MNNCEDISGRLTLYLDNELQGDERLSVTLHLQACDLCKRFLDEERRLMQAIRDARPHYQAPAELRVKVTEILKKEIASTTGEHKPHVLGWLTRRPHVSLRVAFAAVVLLLVIPLIVWRLAGTIQHGGPQPSSFALMAAETHLRRTRGQLPLEIESASPGQISQWFSNKLSFSVKLPNYQESSGQEKLYSLEGGRLVSFKDDYAAYVAYRMSARPISLVITSDSLARPSGGEEISANGLTFHYNAIEGLKVITWSDRGLTYALVSDFEERGQQSCVVCHQDNNDRNLIEKLKPVKN